MNARQYALKYVRRYIPAAILKMAFKPKQEISPQIRWARQNRLETLDSLITETVLEDIVNVDCNLKGGEQIIIPLGGVQFESPNPNTKVYFIPFDRTKGRRITSVLSLNYLDYALPSYTPMQTNGHTQLMSAARDAHNGLKPLPIVATANCSLIGDNVVMCVDSQRYNSKQTALTVLLENADAMANLKPGAYKHYAELALLATKAHIFNTLDLELDLGTLRQGSSLNKIRETIDNYADADEQYKEYYDEFWGKVAFTNDRPRMYNYITSMLGRGL